MCFRAFRAVKSLCFRHWDCNKFKLFILSINLFVPLTHNLYTSTQTFINKNTQSHITLTQSTFQADGFDKAQELIQYIVLVNRQRDRQTEQERDGVTGDVWTKNHNHKVQQRQNVQKENKEIQISKAFIADIQIKPDSGRN